MGDTGLNFLWAKSKPCHLTMPKQLSEWYVWKEKDEKDSDKEIKKENEKVKIGSSCFFVYFVCLFFGFILFCFFGCYQYQKQLSLTRATWIRTQILGSFVCQSTLLVWRRMEDIASIIQFIACLKPSTNAQNF